MCKELIPIDSEHKRPCESRTMKQTSNVCDVSRIDQFLRQQLNKKQHEQFENHLETCRDCRQQLEAATASADVWRGVRESLGSSDFGPDFLDDGGVLSDSHLSSSLSNDDRTGLEISRNSVMRWLAPSDNDRMLGRIGGYEVVGIIGTSSMAVVLKAFDQALNRNVAIKLLAPWLHTNGAARKRFSREAQAAAAVVHENVIEIHCVSAANDLPYLVMPFVSGPSLQRRLNEQGSLQVAEVLRIGMQAAYGLAAAHSQGLVHRDVKPSNILLADGTERVKLTDFGLARAADDASLTRSGIIAGTPQYMSPEQVRGQNVDQRSDLFSLGSVLYAMCTGRPPFRAETSYGVMRQVTDRTPRSVREVNSNIPEWLCGIISRLMAKQPDARFESASAVATVLEQCLAHVHQPTVVNLPDEVKTKSRSGSHLRSRLMAVVACLLAGLSFAGVLVWMNQGADQSANRTKTSPDSRESAAVSTTNSSPINNVAIQTDMYERIHNFANLTTGNRGKIAISPDGKTFALANGNPTMTMLDSNRVDLKGWQATLQIFDCETGEEIRSISLLSNDESEVVNGDNPVRYIQVEAVKYSPDGRTIAVGTNVGQVKLFELNSGELVHTLDDETSRLADEKTPDSWDGLKRALGNVKAIAFSPDGEQLATIGGSFADFSERFDRVERMGFRGTAAGRLKLWNVETGELQHDLEGHNDFANDVVYSPDGQTLASAGRWSTELERFGQGVIIWNPASGTMRNYIRISADGGVHSIQFTSDSQQLLAGTMRFGDGDERSGSVSLHDVSNGQTRWLVTVPGWANSIGVMPDGLRLAVLCGGSAIRFLEVKDGTTINEFKANEDSPRPKWNDLASASTGGKFVIATVEQKNIGVEVWSAKADSEGSAGDEGPPANSTPAPLSEESTNRFVTIATPAEVRLLACSEDGQLIAILNQKDEEDPTIDVYNTAGELLHSVMTFTEDEKTALGSSRNPASSIRSIAVSGESRLVAVGNTLGQVKLYDTATGSLVRSLDDSVKRSATATADNLKEIHRAHRNVASVSFSTDGKRLVTCGESLDQTGGSIKVWNTESGEILLDLAGHTKVADAKLASDASILVSSGSWVSPEGSESGAIVWDSGSGQQIQKMKTGVGSQDLGAIAISSDNNWIAVNSKKSVTVLKRVDGIVLWERDYASIGNTFEYHGGWVALIDNAKLTYVDDAGGILTRVVYADSEKGSRRNVFAMSKNGDVQVLGGVDENGKGIVNILDSSNDRNAPSDTPQDKPHNENTDKSEPSNSFNDLDDATIQGLLNGKWRLISQVVDGKPRKNVFDRYLLEFKDDTVLIEFIKKGESYVSKKVGPSTVTLNNAAVPSEMDWEGEGISVKSVYQFISSNELVIANREDPEASRPSKVEFELEGMRQSPHIAWTFVRANDWWTIDQPYLNLPLTYPEAAKQEVQDILRSPDLQFIKGHAQVRTTNLVYRSQTIPLNMLISKLSRCPDFKVHVTFKKAESTHILHGFDFAVVQFSDETKVNVIINVNSQNIDIERLSLPEVVSSSE